MINTSIIHFFQNITDEALQQIGEHCHDLQFLCVSNCQRLTDASLASIGNGCHSLRYVCVQLSRINRCLLSLYRQRLSWLKVCVCSIVNDYQMSHKPL